MTETRLMAEAWVPTQQLRWVERERQVPLTGPSGLPVVGGGTQTETYRVLQQWWTLLKPTEVKGEWRDVPVEAE